ncbi:MAG: zinc-ribbon domain-containing protein [Bacteroidales bacterium]|nr:zinc-ribbon domain-containing protein [Bacteroidales bacterium]
MAYCSKCGTEIADEVRFCPSCGTPAGASAAQENRQQQQNTETKFSQTMNTTDTSIKFDPADVEKNKAMGVLAYLGILVLIPILAAKDSPFARYHANQGLILCIVCIIYAIAYSILSTIILAISWRLYFLVSIIGLVGVVFAVLCVIGIINAINGRAKELPIIGKYTLLK